MPAHQFTLDNGVPVLFERIDHLHSVAVGVWVKIGSRHERPADYGLSHMLEHMLFKGTQRRTAREIAEALELVGGEINAFTSREYSCFWAKASTEHYPLAMDVLSDALIDSTFDPEEFAKERKVILQEIKMYEDSPDELCMDHLSSTLFDEGLGHPIVGTLRSIRCTDRGQVLQYYRKMYGPDVCFITIVGNAPDDVIAREAQRFSWTRPRSVRRLPTAPAGRFRGGVKVVKKEVEQLHLALGYPGLPLAHEERYVLHLLSSHLGGGMSSVLFQEVREKRGLAYNVYSFVQSYLDLGILGIYCGTGGAKVREVVKVVRTEVERLLDEGIGPRRLEQLKEQLRGNLLLSLEKPSFRMNRLGVNHLYFGRVLPIEEVLDMIASVGSQDVADLARRVFGRGYLAATAVGPVEAREVGGLLRAGLIPPGGRAAAPRVSPASSARPHAEPTACASPARVGPRAHRPLSQG